MKKVEAKKQGLKSKLKQIKQKDGFTIATALVVFVLLMAFAIGIFLISYYNYRNSFNRHQYNQGYVYSKNVVENATLAVENGLMNEIIAKALAKIYETPIVGVEKKYGQEYNFKFSLGKDAITSEPNYIVNTLNNEHIDLVLKVKYLPLNVGGPLSNNPEEYIKLGDRLKIEYVITKTDIRGGKETNFTIIGEYRCTKDVNRNPDGTVVVSPQTGYDIMKWGLIRYKGNIYEK